MDVRIAEGGIGAFVALLLAVVLIVAVVAARRRGHIRSRAALLGLGALVFLLIAYGMTGGLLPVS